LASYLNVFKHCIDIYFSQVTEVDYEFWAVAFHNNKNETIFRKDADADEIIPDPFIVIVVPSTLTPPSTEVDADGKVYDAA
jgi:hypothetical protein